MKKPTWRGVGDVPKRYKIVIGWHEYSGARLVSREELMRNRFFKAWTPVVMSGFTARRFRRPTKEDADHKNCVLAIDEWDGLVVTGWRRVCENPYIVAWKRLPVFTGVITGAKAPELKGVSEQ